ncbi:MAG: nickel pincer cofactor biosynthesis protein LarB [Candidatus Omnitrophica bacterium]|nr:nickel pincer cofactor biosynthesis protein LarB [Candidatus Omnitrophota bacterium]
MRALKLKNKIKEIDDIAKLDIYRDKRCGIPEVIFAENKELKWLIRILIEMTKKRGYAIATRVNKICLGEIKRKLPPNLRLQHYEEARIITVSKTNYKWPKQIAKVGLIAAGTTDISVAEEARVVMELLGCEVISAYDVGVAGIHRLLLPLEEMLKVGVSCIVVVAGMEGTLPTVVKSLVDVPVIGVPTSTGYGYGGKGESALMTMLQSCSPGLVVVNIDNGFGAACAAVLITKQGPKR